MSRHYYLSDMDPALNTYTQHTMLIKDSNVDIDKFFGYGVKSKYVLFEISGIKITGLITGIQIKHIGSDMEIELTFVDHYMDKETQLSKLDIEFDIQIACEYCYIPTHVTVWEAKDGRG